MANTGLIPMISNPAALAGLALVVPIILLYLLKPKPKLVMFPSTMFIRILEKNKRFTSFLQKFIHDPLLLVQLFLVCLLVFTVADPFITTQQGQRPQESVVILLDVSASMQATDVRPNRFDTARIKASSIIEVLNQDSEVSIVLASSIPITLLNRGNKKQAREVLSKVEVMDTPSSVGDAILLAKDILSSSDRKKIVYVLSDFSPGGGLDPLVAKKIAVTNGIEVELIQVGFRGANTAIVSLDARRSHLNDNELYLTMSVKNYHPLDYNVVIKVSSGAETILSEQKALKPGSDNFYYFKPNITSDEHLLRVELIGMDDLPLDDVAYAHIPPAKLNRVLLLTSDGSDKYLRLMFDSLASAKKIIFEYAVPPVTPEFSGYDVVILGNVQSDNILPGMFRDIKNQVSSGASLIVIGTSNLAEIKNDNLWSVMPCKIISLSDRESSVEVVTDHDILNDVVFDNLVLKKQYNVETSNNSSIELVRSKASYTPLISFMPYGEGYVAYMGINTDPDWSNLYYSSSFPIFYNQMIKYFTRKRGISATPSLFTGDYLQTNSNQTIKTPSGELMQSSNIFLDKAGVYKIMYPDRQSTVPVNLMSAIESNTSVSDLSELNKASEYSNSLEDVDVDIGLFKYLVFAIIIALFFETVMYKRRGML